MSHKFLPFVIGVCVLVIFAFVLVKLAVAPEKESGEELTLSVDQTATSTVPTSTAPISDKVALTYGEFRYEKLGDNNYHVETQVTANDIRPFTNKTMVLTLSAGSYFGTKDSDFTDSAIAFVGKTGDFEIFYDGEMQGTSSVATIFNRTDATSFDDDIKNIAIGNRFALESPQEAQAFTDTINKYCRVVENTSSDTKTYNFIPSAEFYRLAESEQMNYGPFLCGAGTYYIFDEFVVKAHFVSDGIRVSDIKLQ